jgi:hypothetical protein
MTQLDYIRAVAREFVATELNREGVNADYRLELALPSGIGVTYHLRMTALSGGRVAVKEHPPERLPACCPDRHINPGGTFCLSWEEVDPLLVSDNDGARRWWSYVVQFLRCQEVAAAIGRWVGPGYAHGDAAKYQFQAERAADELGRQVKSLMESGCLATRRRVIHGRQRIELMNGGAVVARINENSGRVSDLRMPCICSAHESRPIGECGKHADYVGVLVSSLYQISISERQFMSALRASGVRCCRTLSQCSLA